MYVLSWSVMSPSPLASTTIGEPGVGFQVVTLPKEVLYASTCAWFWKIPSVLYPLKYHTGLPNSNEVIVPNTGRLAPSTLVSRGFKKVTSLLIVVKFYKSVY